MQEERSYFEFAFQTILSNQKAFKINELRCKYSIK